MKIFITKSALTTGILEIEAELEPTGGARPTDRKHGYYIGKQHVYTSRDAAKAKAEKMKWRKIELLNKEIARLQDMEF